MPNQPHGTPPKPYSAKAASSQSQPKSNSKSSNSASKSHPIHSQPCRSKKASQAKWRRQLRYFYIRFVRMRGTPKAIARGLAAGVFAGWFPLFGLQTIIGVAIAAALRANKIMAAAGTWVSNPLTYVPIYYFNFRVGQVLLSEVGFEADMPDLETLQDIITASGWDAFSEFLGLGVLFIVTLFLGCLVTGSVSAIAAYGIGLKLAQVMGQHRTR